jgi:hypothetical protein
MIAKRRGEEDVDYTPQAGYSDPETNPSSDSE